MKENSNYDMYFKYNITFLKAPGIVCSSFIANTLELDGAGVTVEKFIGFISFRFNL